MIDDLELVNRIYEAAVIPEMWPAVLDDLSKIATCYGGTLLSMDPQQEVRHIASEQFRGMMELFIRDGWNQQNIRAEKFMQTKYAGFLTDTDLISIEDMDRHPFYTDLVRPNGGGFAIGTIIPVPSGDLLVFNLERSCAEGPVEKSLCKRLDSFRPHLARAGLLSVRLRMERVRAMVDALEQIGLPAAVLRQNGRALATNHSFKSLRKQIDIGAFDSIKITNPASDTLLKRSLATSRSPRVSRDVKSIPIPAIDDQSPLIAHLVPIEGAAHDIFSRASTLLVVTPMQAPDAPSEDVLNGLFDLTAAEVKVAQRIAAGRTVDVIASELKLSRETVRSQLKSVFAKTGTGRQAELVGLLLGATLPRKR